MDVEKSQQMQRQMEELTLMMDTVPIQMWFLTDAETYGRVNRYHADFVGRPKEEMEFKKYEGFLPKDVAGVCRQSNRDVFVTGRAVRTEEWIPNSGGERRLIAITKTPKFNGNGRIEYIVCAGIDITERRQAEARLAQSEENFRAFIETIDEIAVIGDMEGRIVYANPAATSKLGYTPQELQTKHILDLHPAWNRREAQSILNDMFNGLRTTCPLPLSSKNGSIIPVETRIWLGKWNGLNCVFGLSKDLSTEQEALQKFDRLFRMNPALMAVSSVSERTFIDINDAFVNKLGYQPKDVIGRTSRELGLFPNEHDQERATYLLAKYGSIREVELKIKTKTGRTLEGLFSGEVIESQGTKYFLTVMIDITDRKQAEAEREKTIQELKSAVEHIKTLSGILPICANCKKIRNDKGYWERVEAYVSRRTDAQFSHGICPDCEKKLYSQFLSPNR